MMPSELKAHHFVSLTGVLWVSFIFQHKKNGLDFILEVGLLSSSFGRQGKRSNTRSIQPKPSLQDMPILLV